MEEVVGFDYWNLLLPGPEAADASSSLQVPPALSSDGWAGINDQCPAEGSWAALEDGDQSMLAGDDIFFDSLLLDAPSSGPGSGAIQVAPAVDSSGIADSAGADHPCGMTMAAGSSKALQEEVGPDSPTGPDQADMMMTLADMIRIAEQCGNDEAAGRAWSGEEHKHLLHCLRQRYAKHEHDGPNRCFRISTSLLNKTAADVALRCRWLQDKEKHSKQAGLVEKHSAGVKLNKGQGTKGTKKHNNMYPLSKEALDSKSTKELLRDSYIFMQQIEENIKTGKLGDHTAEYFYYMKTNIDAIGKRENKFCRISIPMPSIDEQGLEEILQQSRHN